MIDTLVILGAYGDLTGRYLLPALAQLAHDELLPKSLRILAVDQMCVDEHVFREHAAKELTDHVEHLPAATRGQLCQRLHYIQGDVTDSEDLDAVVSHANGPVVVYLALPNTVFAGAVNALAKSRLPSDSRLVLEKPFGVDQADARHLNNVIRQRFTEDRVFRVDHFLAKQTVLNVLGLRFANRLFEPAWNALHIEAVDIVWDETSALRGRAGYYDRAGALRDMIQNHLLQLLALVAMEPPPSLGEYDLRDRKADVLRAVRPPGPQRASAMTRRARYTAGRAEDGEVPDYVDERGVDPDRMTETFAETTLFIDNWRWAGVPFRLRTGKALGTARREIAACLRPVPHQPFGEPAPADVVRFSLDPDEIAVEVNLNGAGDPFELDRENLLARFPAPDLRPYSRLLLEILEGDPTLSIRDDEAEESWRIVEPILAAWNDGRVPLEEYAAGTAFST